MPREILEKISSRMKVQGTTKNNNKINLQFINTRKEVAQDIQEESQKI